MGPRAYRYKAFLSYSHESDRAFAPVLQRTIERLAKPWYRRRAISLFRDQTDIAVKPGLWPRIAAALDDSEYFLLLGSPAAAQSPWVAREIEHWREQHDIAKLIVAVTDGQIVWDDARADFDWTKTTALPPSLTGAFASEPLWADFHDARTAKGNDATVREPAVRLTAGLRDMSPRDVDGEDLRQHRRALRVAGAAVATLLILTIVSVFATVQALRQRGLAISREFAALSAARLDVDPELSVLLALHAGEVAATPQAERALRAAVPLAYGRRSFRNPSWYPNTVAFNADGSRIVVSSGWAIFGKGQDFTSRIFEPGTGRVVATLEGHGAPVVRSFFSSDGRTVLTQADESTARLWNADTGSLRATLDHGATIQMAAFAPDGRTVVTGGDDGVARTWDVATGAARVSIKGSDDAINDVCFNPNGRLLLTTAGRFGIADGIVSGVFAGPHASRFTAVVWDAASGREQRRFTPLDLPVSKGLFSPDGRFVLIVTVDRASLWSVVDGRRVAELLGHRGSITDAVFSGDGRWIATASSDATSRVWSAQTGALRAELSGHRLGLHSVAISADGRRVVTAGADPFAIVWDVATARPLGHLRGHEEALTGLAVSQDGETIATTSHDGWIRLWRAPAGEVLQPLGPAGRVDRMELSADGERISAEADRAATVWSRRTGARLGAFGPVGSFSHPAWSSDGRRVLLPLGDSTALVDADGGAKIKTFSRSFNNAALDPSGRQVATYNDRQRALELWDAITGQLRASVPLDISVAEQGIQYSADGARILLKQFAIGGGELHDATTGTRLATFTASKIAFSPSGRLVLEVDAKDGSDTVPRVYDARTGIRTATLGAVRPFIHDAVITSSDRRVIVVVDEEVEVWDFEPVRLASTFHMSHPLLGRLAVSPDGCLIAMSGARSVEVWDVERQRQVVELTGHSQDVRAVAFSPDGRSVVTAAPDTTIRIYPAEAFLPFDEVLSRARTNVSRSLTLEELQALSAGR